jgi:UPF0716 protein FxsA
MLAFALFFGLPILEIVLLVQAGILFGIWWLLAWILASALIGIVLVRRQGLAAIQQAQSASTDGEIPVGAILTGIRLAFAGIFLIVPGFITDALGLLLLLPWTGNSLGRVMTARVQMHSTWRGSGAGYGDGGTGRRNDVDIVDADFEVVATKDTAANDQTTGSLVQGDNNPWQKR